jgi:hypothetical protein
LGPPAKATEARMQFRLGRMSVGDILDRSLKLFLSRLGTFYAISLIVQSPLIAFQILAPTPTEMGWNFVLIVGGTVLLSFVLTLVGMAAQIKVIEQEFIDRKIGIGEAFGFALTRSVPVIVVSFVLGIIFTVGLYLCCVPGVIFMCMFAVAVQAVVLEGDGPFDGMGRSVKLTKNYRGRIFLIGFLYFILYIMVVGVLAVVLNKFVPANQFVIDANGLPKEVVRNQTNQIIQILITTPITIFFSTYLTICLTLVYFDLRTRKEGFDLELLARGMPQDRRRRSRGDDDYEDDDDDRPRRRRAADDDDDDRPRRRGREDEADEDDRPRRRRDLDDDHDDRPRRRGREDEDDRPRRRRDLDDDDDDRPRQRD